MPGTDTKVAGKKYKIKKKGTDVTLAFARVLVFLFDAVYTLIIVSVGINNTKYRSYLLIGSAVLYILTAILMTIINRQWKDGFHLTCQGCCTQLKNECHLACQRCSRYAKRCKARTCTTNDIKETLLIIIELVVILFVILYYIGDNFEEAKFTQDKEKSSTYSTMLIIVGLIGIYLFSTIHDNILDYNKKKEKLLNDFMEKGKIEKEKWNNQNRNAENCEKLYKFIIKIFSVIPIIDGLYTSILDECKNNSYLYALLAIIMIILIINVMVVSRAVVKEMRQVEIEIDAVKEGSTINGGTVKVFNGKVICKSASESETKRYTIEGGTKVATQSEENETMTIWGTEIKITGGKNQTSNSGGTTIIKSKDEESNVNITTSKGELFYTNGTTTIEGGTVANDDEGTQENDDTIVYEGETTTITHGTTTFTADSTTIIGGEVLGHDWRNWDTTNYEGTCLDKNPIRLKVIVGSVAVCNLLCIGLFLIADNLQPLDCSSSNSKAIYWIRIIFLFLSIIAYCFSMFIAFLSWKKSKDWVRKEDKDEQDTHTREDDKRKEYAINEEDTTDAISLLPVQT